MRDFTSALAAFRQAVNLDPQLVDAWSIIVRLQAAMGDSAGAVDSLGAALSANPGNPDLLSLTPSDQE